MLDVRRVSKGIGLVVEDGDMKGVEKTFLRGGQCRTDLLIYFLSPTLVMVLEGGRDRDLHCNLEN